MRGFDNKDQTYLYVWEISSFAFATSAPERWLGSLGTWSVAPKQQIITTYQAKHFVRIIFIKEIYKCRQVL